MNGKVIVPILLSDDPALASQLRSALATAEVNGMEPLRLSAELAASVRLEDGTAAIIFLDCREAGAVTLAIAEARARYPEAPLLALVGDAAAGESVLDVGADGYLTLSEVTGVALARALRFLFAPLPATTPPPMADPQLLGDISLAINRAATVRAVAEAAASGLTRAFTTDNVAIALLAGDRLSWEIVVDDILAETTSLRGLHLEASPARGLRRQLAERGFLTRADLETAPRLAPLAAIFEERGLDRLDLFPVRRDEDVIGFVLLRLEQAQDRLDEKAVAFARTVADLLALKLEQLKQLEGERRARSHAEDHANSLRMRERHMWTLNAITRATTGLGTSEMLQTAVDRLAELSGADACYVTIWDDRRRLVLPKAAYGPLRDTFRDFHFEPGEVSLTETVLAAKGSLIVDDLSNSRLLSPRLAAAFQAESAIAIPLISGDEKLGALLLTYTTRHDFAEVELRLLEQAAGQIALALAKNRLFDATRRQLEELTLLHALAAAGAAADDEHTLLEQATRLLGDMFDCDNFGILLLDDKNGVLIPHDSYRRGEQEERPHLIPLGVGICGDVALNGRSRLVPDVSASDEYVEADPAARSELCVPLQVDGRVYGVVNLESTRLMTFTEADERLLSTFASQLATALAKLRLLTAERRRRQEAEALQKATAVLTSSLERDEVLDNILDQLEQVVPFDTARLLLLEEDRLPVVAWRGGEPAPESMSATASALFTELRASKETIRVADARQDSRFRFLTGSGARAAMVVPLVAGDQVIGYLTLSSVEPDLYGDGEANLARALANQAAVAVDNAGHYATARRHARELRAMSDILRSLNAQPDVRVAFPQVAAGLRAITACYRASLVLFNDKQDAFTFLGLDQPEAAPLPGDWYPLAQTTAAADLLSGRTHLTPDLAAEQVGAVERALAGAGLQSRISMPLRIGETVIGALNLGWRRSRGYSEQQFPLLRQIADAIALALERSRLFSELEANLKETQALNQVSRTLIDAKSLPSLLKGVVASVAEALPADRVLLVTVDLQARQILESVANDNGRVRMSPLSFEALWQGLSGFVLREREPVLSPKGKRDLRESDQIHHLREENGGGSIIVVPLQYRDEVLGTLTAMNHADGPEFGQRNVDLMTSMANQAAIAIANARLFAQTEQRAAELETLSELSAALRVAEGTAQIMEIILDSGLELLGGDAGTIVVPTSDPDTLRVALEKNVPASLKPFDFRVGDSIFGHVLATGAAYVTDDLLADEFVHPSARQAWSAQTTSPAAGIFVPLRAGEAIVGILSVTKFASRGFDEENMRLLVAMAEIAGSALQRAGVMETLEQRVIERTRELAEAYERLKELDRLKSKFVSDISHEMRTPATNLNLYMDLFEKSPPERGERYWAVLRKQANRLSKLIDDILSLSRLEMNKDEVQFAHVDLNARVAGAVEAQRAEAEARGLELTFVAADVLPPLWGAPEQLDQVIDNLLTNAMTYTSVGAVTVSTGHDAGQAMALLTITDTGVGISADDLPHIFERFYRGEESAQSTIPGTGLGLAIVDEIVSLHGGAIEVESEPGKGTVVRVCLPLEAQPETT